MVWKNVNLYEITGTFWKISIPHRKEKVDKRKNTPFLTPMNLKHKIVWGSMLAYIWWLYKSELVDYWLHAWSYTTL